MVYFFGVFFFKQKTAYEMRISDWSSDVCSSDLMAGKRVGVPEWAQTAAVYTRGWLQHEAGVDLKSIDWYQAGTEQPGRIEKVELDLPKGLRLPDRKSVV